MHTFLLFFQQAPDTPSTLMSFLPFILIMVIIYFLMMRPQIKNKRKTKDA